MHGHRPRCSLTCAANANAGQLGAVRILDFNDYVTAKAGTSAAIQRQYSCRARGRRALRRNRNRDPRRDRARLLDLRASKDLMERDSGLGRCDCPGPWPRDGRPASCRPIAPALRMRSAQRCTCRKPRPRCASRRDISSAQSIANRWWPHTWDAGALPGAAGSTGPLDLSITRAASARYSANATRGRADPPRPSEGTIMAANVKAISLLATGQSVAAAGSRFTIGSRGVDRRCPVQADDPRYADAVGGRRTTLPVKLSRARPPTTAFNFLAAVLLLDRGIRARQFERRAAGTIRRCAR